MFVPTSPLLGHTLTLSQPVLSSQWINLLPSLLLLQTYTTDHAPASIDVFPSLATWQPVFNYGSRRSTNHRQTTWTSLSFSHGLSWPPSCGGPICARSWSASCLHLPPPMPLLPQTSPVLVGAPTWMITSSRPLDTERGQDAHQLSGIESCLLGVPLITFNFYLIWRQLSISSSKAAPGLPLYVQKLSNCGIGASSTRSDS